MKTYLAADGKGKMLASTRPPTQLCPPLSVLSLGEKHLARRNLCLEKTPFYHALIMNLGC